MLNRVVEIVQGRPQGVTYQEIRALLATDFPEASSIKRNYAIQAAVNERPDSVCRPRRGLYVPPSADPSAWENHHKPVAIPEEAFYQAFADWLGQAECCD